MKRYVVTEKYGVIDTKDTKKYRHIECFKEEDGQLLAEDMSGHIYNYAEIIDQFDEWRN